MRFKLCIERAVLTAAWAWSAMHCSADTGRPPAPAEPGEASPAPLGFGIEVPFGPMLAIAALIYFLALHRWVDDYFANLAVML